MESKIVRTVSHKNFKEPTFLEISYYLTTYGISSKQQHSYSFDLLADLCNAYTHVLFGSSVKKSLVDLSMLLNQGLITQEEYEYNKNIQDIILSINFNCISGSNPFDKALNAYTLFKDVLHRKSNKTKEENKINNEKKIKELNETINQLRVMIKAEQDDEVINIINQKLIRLEDERQLITDGIVIDTEENLEIDASIVSAIMVIVNRQQKLLGMLRSESSIENLMFRDHKLSPEENIQKLSDRQKRLLEKMAILKSRGNIKVVKSPNIRKVQQMEHIGEIGKLASFSSMVLPNFQYKLCTNQLQVNRDIPEDKQNLLLMIDDSSSMNTTEKKLWVEAIVYNRLEAVINNKARLLICWFEKTIHRHIIVENRDEALAFIKTGSFGSFTKGITNIESCLKQAIQLIKKLFEPDLSKCQIVIINDGDDPIDRRYTPEIVTHGFILGIHNEDLETIIKNSRGKYEIFQERNSV